MNAPSARARMNRASVRLRLGSSMKEVSPATQPATTAGQPFYREGVNSGGYYEGGIGGGGGHCEGGIVGGGACAYVSVVGLTEEREGDLIGGPSCSNERGKAHTVHQW